MLYDVLCIIITAVGEIIDIINVILRTIIFGVVLKFNCFLKHPFNADKRSSCRCSACLALNSSTPPNVGVIAIPPSTWDGSVDANVNLIDDRTECAACYDASDGDASFTLVSLFDLTPYITTNTVDATTSGTFSATSSGEGGDATFTVTVSGGVVTSIIVLILVLAIEKMIH